MIQKLDFVVIGAQKCATSWLYYCLREHPQVIVPKKKLEVSYIGGKMFKEKGYEWFFEQFPKNSEGEKAGDVSVDYLYDLNAASELKKYTHDRTKIFVSLRNPADRLISAYYWFVRTGQIDDKPMLESLGPLLNAKVLNDKYLKEPHFELYNRGSYSEQLNQYLAHFSPDNIYPFLYEDILHNSSSIIKRIYEALGVDAEFIPESLERRPKFNSRNSKLLNIESKTAHLPFIIRYPIQKIANSLHQFSPRKDETRSSENEIRKQLLQLYKEEIVNTDELLKRSFKNYNNHKSLKDIWS